MKDPLDPGMWVPLAAAAILLCALVAYCAEYLLTVTGRG
jgi:hypothetical protein